MSNGKALVEGIVYLANKFASGETSEVQVTLSRYDNLLHIYLLKDRMKIFDAVDVEFMESLGFHYEECSGEDFEEHTYQDEDYSYFYISV